MARDAGGEFDCTRAVGTRAGAIAAGGVVVNIASTDGLTGSDNSMAYGVSKAALSKRHEESREPVGAQRDQG